MKGSQTHIHFIFIINRLYRCFLGMDHREFGTIFAFVPAGKKKSSHGREKELLFGQYSRSILVQEPTAVVRRTRDGRAWMRRISLAVLLVGTLCVLWNVSCGRAEDLDVFVGGNVKPNVLIILDSSGSMDEDDAGSPYEPGRTYGPWVNMPDKGSNYDNWYWYNRQRWQIAKNVITHLVDETEGVRFGFMRMDGSLSDRPDYYGRHGSKLDYWGIPDLADLPYDPDNLFSPDSFPPGYPPSECDEGMPPDLVFHLPHHRVRHGGKLLRPCGTDSADLVNFVNGFDLYKTVPNTYTNMAETLFTAGQYFAGGHDAYGMGTYKDSDDTNWPYDVYWARDTDDYGNTIDITSPVQDWCQQNFVIFISDGEGTCDSDWTRMLEVMQTVAGNATGDMDGDGREVPDAADKPKGGAPIDLHHYLDDVAKFVYENDLREDMDGVQNVVTYVVGFALNDPAYDPVRALLRQTAEYGGGAYYTADNYDELREAFNQIVSDIFSRTSSYVAPVIPVQQSNRTFSGDDIYLALFKPEDNGFWPGNIKKFKLATHNMPPSVAEGDMIDRDSTKATDDRGGILDTARSFWPSSTEPDGGYIFKGGVGELLLTRTTPRSIYTYTGGTPLLTDPTNRFSATNNDITAGRLGVTTQTERNDIISFVHGYDVYDEDEDGNTTEKRDWILGDFVHSGPAVFSYTADRTVIFVGGNDGMLHAFDAADGSELWAYVPPVFLEELKDLSGPTHRYFIDGSPVVWYQENPTDTDKDIDPLDGDQVLLICGLRRGGEGYFALDVTDPDNPKIPAGWATWEYEAEEAGSGGSGGPVNVTNLSPLTYETGLFAQGERVYMDRMYVFDAIPDSEALALTGNTYILTANDDKGHEEGTWSLTFDIDQDATIYVGHDSRITPKPSWLSSWTDTHEDILTEGEEKRDLSLVECNYAYPGEGWDNAIDSDTAGWDGTVSANDSPPYAIFRFDDGSTKALSKIRLMCDTGVGYSDRWADRFTVQVSTTDTAPSSFVTVLDRVEKTGGDWQEYVIEPTNAKYIKVILDEPSSGWRQIGEFEVYCVTLLRLYSKDFSAGPVTLDGNLTPGYLDGKSMYTVIVAPQPSSGEETVTVRRKSGMIGPVMSKNLDVADFPYEHMGQTWSRPKIEKVMIGSVETWVAFVGGGYDDKEDVMPPLPDPKGRAVYCFDIQSGDKVWGYTADNNPFLDRAVPSDVAVLDGNGDGRTDRIYVGDLGARLWRFDVGSDNTNDWTSSAKLVFESNPGIDGGGRKIFSPPDIVEENEYFMIFVGTGDRAHPNRRDVINRIYAIKDRKGTTLYETDLVDVTQNRLQDPSTTPAEKADILYNLTANPNYHGWFIQLLNENDDNAEGEKALSRAVVYRRVVYITTFTPASEDLVEDPCLVAQGKAQLYALKYMTGEAAFNLDLTNDTPTDEVIQRVDRSQIVGSGIPSDPVLVIRNNTVFLYVAVGIEATQGAGGGMGVYGAETGPRGNLLRVFWRELD